MSRRWGLVWSRVLVVCVLAGLLGACAVGGSRVVSTTRSSRSYAVVTPRAGDTPQALALRYLDDARKGWIIEEFNGVETLSPDSFVTIPLMPLYRGGLGEGGGFQTVPVLVYSAFSEQTSDVFSMKRDRFRAQLQYLKDNGITPLTLEEFVRFIEFGDHIPERSVLITIDDVGQNTFEIAFDELQRFGFPATVFVCTDLVADRTGALSWDRIRTMRDAGMAIEHRTKTLRNLARRMGGETLEDYIINVDRELTVASLTFQSELGQRPSWLAYPFGTLNEAVVELLRKNGFRGAFTMEERVSPFFVDNYAIPRIRMPGDISMDAYAEVMRFGVDAAERGTMVDGLQAAFAAGDDEPYAAVVTEVMARADAASADGQWIRALELYRIAGTLNRRAPGVRRKAQEAKKNMDARAAELLAAARTARDGGDRAAARDAYVEALRYDPSPEVAAELKAMLSPPTHRELALTQSDTLRRIAEREYGNPGGEILLAKVNNKSVVDILDPGEMVKLPILSEALAQRIEISLAPVEQVAPVAPAEPAQEEMMTEPEAEAVEVVIQETPADRITPLLSMARLQFGNGLYETVVSITNEILQLDPGNEQALEIQRESYYSLAEGFISDGSNVRAMRMLRNLPRDYRATKELTGKVQQALDTTSEPLYLQGVNYYINEELERAVDSWELTLQANPWHKKARSDLEKARKLLEAVRGL